MKRKVRPVWTGEMEIAVRDYRRLLLKVVKPKNVAKLIKMVNDGRITYASGREVLGIMFDQAEAAIRRWAESLPQEPATIPPSSWCCRYDYLSFWACGRKEWARWRR